MKNTFLIKTLRRNPIIKNLKSRMLIKLRAERKANETSGLKWMWLIVELACKGDERETRRPCLGGGGSRGSPAECPWCD